MCVCVPVSGWYAPYGFYQPYNQTHTHTHIPYTVAEFIFIIFIAREFWVTWRMNENEKHLNNKEQQTKTESYDIRIRMLC